VFLLATYGEGGPTDDCIEFYSKLKNGFLDDVVDENKYLCYSIFGLGSSKYENFNSISKTFDKAFQSRRIKRVCNYGEGDDAKNISEDFEQWKRNFWVQSYAYFKENREKYTVGIEKLELKKLYEGVKAELEISLVDSKDVGQEQDLNNNDQVEALMVEDYDFATKRYLQSEEYQIEEIKELRRENINGSTLEISYYSSENNFKYGAADNIGIYPVNSEASVNAVLNRLNYNSKQIVSVKKLKKGELQKKVSIPNGLSIGEVLTNILDLSCSIK
jgi:NADPH-ferrihemoprotein reductase